MYKVIIIALTVWIPTVSDAVDINQADVAALDSVRGIGPSMSRSMLQERGFGKFKDWPDLMSRVPGIKEKTATKLSIQGLTVDGNPFVVVPGLGGHPNKLSRY